VIVAARGAVFERGDLSTMYPIVRRIVVQSHSIPSAKNVIPEEMRSA
jgi:hypothetical protein